tara:strand:+ start:1266 stop:1463 length:198 start_codon:yes stop_codon:yes gene_type:complete
MNKITEEEMKAIILEILEVDKWSELSISGSFDGNDIWCSQQSEAYNMLAAIEMVVEKYESGALGV